jgi:hypothetical protein
VTVTCTKGSGTWTPPAGVTSAQVDVEGAGGGSGSTSAGGAGGSSKTTLTVSSANTYSVLVGAQGSSQGGGGRSEIDLGTSRLVVAGGGGGGGGGFNTGGAGGGGGGTSGTKGGDGSQPAGCNGSAGLPGTDTTVGTQGSGTSGCLANGSAGNPGSGPSGGGGGAGASAQTGGGGGGDGFFGGGGGGGGGNRSGILGGGGGGGGGSGHLDLTTTTGGSTGPGTNTGDGTVTITYTLPSAPPSLVRASSAFAQGVPSISTRLSKKPACGDVLIAEVQEAEGTATTTSVTDGNLSFTRAKIFLGPPPDNTEVTIWTLKVPCGVTPTPGRTVTATPSNNSDMGIAVLEYTGLTGGIDDSGGVSGYTFTVPTTTVNSEATASAGDLVVGFEADSGWQVNLGADTSGGYTERVNVQNNQVAEFLVEDQVAASSGTYIAKATITYTSATAGDLLPFGFTGVPYVMLTIAFAHS